MKKALLVLIVVMVVITSLFAFSACNRADGNIVSIKDSARGQVMKGFGASSAWWSQIIGLGENKEEVAKLLYGDEGMALNIYRYNIGGGSKDILDKSVTGTYATCWDNESELSAANYYWELDRLTESFLKGEEYTGTTHEQLLEFVSNDDNYDFTTRDVGAQEMLKACYDLGNIDEVLLFVNSPNYIMTKNGQCRSSDGEKKTENLAEENYDVFAVYLMKILKHFINQGYPVKYISPINEPQWNWCDWKQEGCYYEPTSVAKCLNVVNNHLKEFNTANNTNVKIDGYESGNWRWKGSNNNPSRNGEYLEALSAYDYFNELDYVSMHSYSNPYKRSDREDFMKKSKAYNIQVGISEYCQMLQGVQLDNFYNAQLLALVMSYDMSILKSNEWNWWIGVSNEKTYNYEDGLIYTNWWSDYNDEFAANYYGDIHTGEKDSVRVSPRFYTMKHYANFVSAGDVYLDLDISKKSTNLGIHATQQDSDLFSAFKVTSMDGESEDKMPYSDKIYNAFLKADGTVVIVYTNVVEDPITWNIEDKFSSFEAYTSTSGNYFQKSEGKFKGSYQFPGNSIVTLVLHP